MSELAVLPGPAPRRWPAAAAPDVDIVVPGHDEEALLERSVRRLHRFLRDGFPFSWRIVVADNASTDATPRIAEVLAEDLPGAGAVRLERKGRGGGAGAPLRVGREPGAGRGLHGRRPLDRPARAAPARGAAAVGPQRPGDRHAALPQRAGGTRAQARADISRPQPA